MIVAATCTATTSNNETIATATAVKTLGASSSRRHRKKPYKSWLKDGVNGGPSSMQVVVRWLSANYASKWRDGSDTRMPKKLLLQEILDQMQRVGIRHRLAKDVASKISTLQTNYRIAREWYDVIGNEWRKAGAQEADVHKEVLRRFPYWDELHDVFGNSTSFATPTTMTTTTTTTTMTATTTTTTTTTTVNHDKYGPMSIRSIIHCIDDPEESLAQAQEAAQDWMNQEQETSATFLMVSGPVQAAAAAAAAATMAATVAMATQTGTLPSLMQEEPVDEIHQYERLLAEEKEKTRRVRAKASLVKRLIDSGCTKEEIAAQLKMCL